MHLNCQSCGAEISANDINLDRLIAKCCRCNAVFSFAKKLGQDSIYEPTAQKLRVGRPKSMAIRDLATELTVTRKWFEPTFYFLAFFALVWNGLLLPFALIAVFSGQWEVLISMSLHLLAGVAIAYYTLVLLLNSTEIRVDRHTITVSHGPLPMYQTRVIAAPTITQIYCKEKISYFRKIAQMTYEVYGITRDQRRLELITGLPSAEDAMFLEQEIERFLRLEDRPIRGEYCP